MIRGRSVTNTTNPPGQVRYRETTNKGMYLRDVIERIQQEEKIVERLYPDVILPYPQGVIENGK